jgi:hypothetical protein
VLYTCNDFGVYVSTNGGASWEVLGGNLPSVNVMDFIVHPSDPVLVAASARPRRMGDRRVPVPPAVGAIDLPADRSGLARLKARRPKNANKLNIY